VYLRDTESEDTKWREEVNSLPKKPDRREREMVHVRLDADLVRRIDHLAVEWRLYRNETMERLLKEAMEKYRQQEAARTI
jgi:hypothetical protein